MIADLRLKLFKNCIKISKIVLLYTRIKLVKFNILKKLEVEKT